MMHLPCGMQHPLLSTLEVPHSPAIRQALGHIFRGLGVPMGRASGTARLGVVILAVFRVFQSQQTGVLPFNLPRGPIYYYASGVREYVRDVLASFASSHAYVHVYTVCAWRFVSILPKIGEVCTHISWRLTRSPQNSSCMPLPKPCASHVRWAVPWVFVGNLVCPQHPRQTTLNYQQVSMLFTRASKVQAGHSPRKKMRCCTGRQDVLLIGILTR